MRAFGLEQLHAEISAVKSVHSMGRVVEAARGVLMVSGLSDTAALGDLVEIGHGEKTRRGEVLQLHEDTITILPDGGRMGCRLVTRLSTSAKTKLPPTTVGSGA